MCATGQAAKKEAEAAREAARKAVLERDQESLVSFTFYERQLGLTLMGIDETGYRPDGDTPCAYIMVTNVQKMSEAAAQATTLKGLAVRAVEGRPMHGLSFNATANEIRQAPRPIT
eukprot:COSAG01_NODE_35234_length_534_cov_275.154023_1_plen_115_part_10